MVVGIFRGWKRPWSHLQDEPPGTPRDTATRMMPRMKKGFGFWIWILIVLVVALLEGGFALPARSVDDPAPLSAPFSNDDGAASAASAVRRRRPEKPKPEEGDAAYETLRRALERSRTEIARLREDVRDDSEKIEDLRRVVCRLLAALCATKGSPCMECPWPTHTTTTTTTTTTRAPETTTTKMTTTTTAAPTTTISTTPITTTKTESTTTTSKTEATTTTPEPSTTTMKTTTTTTGSNTTTAATTGTTATTTPATTTPKPTPDPGAKCDDPKPPVNGYIVGNETTLGSEVQVKCKDGYQLVGVPTMQCTALWSDETHAFSYNWAPPMSAVCKATGTFVAPNKKPEEVVKDKEKDAKEKN